MTNNYDIFLEIKKLVPEDTRVGGNVKDHMTYTIFNDNAYDSLHSDLFYLQENIE